MCPHVTALFGEVLCFKVKVSMLAGTGYFQQQGLVMLFHPGSFLALFFSHLSQALGGKLYFWVVVGNINRLLKEIYLERSFQPAMTALLPLKQRVLLALGPFFDFQIVKCSVLNSPKPCFNSVWYLNGNYLVILVSATIILPLALMKQLGEWIQDGRHVRKSHPHGVLVVITLSMDTCFCMCSFDCELNEDTLIHFYRQHKLGTQSSG